MLIGGLMYIYTCAVNEYTQFDFDYHVQQYQSSHKSYTEVYFLIISHIYLRYMLVPFQETWRYVWLNWHWF